MPPPFNSTTPVRIRRPIETAFSTSLEKTAPLSRQKELFASDRFFFRFERRNDQYGSKILYLSNVDPESTPASMVGRTNQP